MKKELFSGGHHYCVVCRDLEESIAFYRDVLSFEFIAYAQEKSETEDIKFAYMKNDTLLLALIEPKGWKDEACEWASVGLNHLCLICGDGNATEEMLRAKHGVVFESIEDEPDWKCLFFRGPNEERIEIMEIRSDMFPVVYTTPNDSPYIRGMGHVGIFSGDYDASIHFYCDVMGFEHLITFEEGGPDMPYWNKNAVLKLGDAVIELLCPLQHPVVREKYYYQARMQMTLYGMKPAGTVQEAADALRGTEDIEWIQGEVDHLPDLPPGNDIDWVSFRDPNGFLWEIVQDV
ncbi:MAG: VOC family protein [Eubacterium sp.]|nr:VOC family protein [Eubacterium sp.]